MAIVQPVSGRDSLNSIANGQTYLDNLADQAPFMLKPKSLNGINGFLFDFEGESSLKLEAEITDHYAEDNSAVQDHVAIKPDRLTLRGYKGELVMRQPGGVLGALGTVQSALTQVPAYLGKYTPGAVAVMAKAVTQAQNVVTQIQQAAARVSNLIGLLPGSAPGDTVQKQAFAQLSALMKTRQVCTVETPWRVYTNLVIERLEFVQPEETRSWSDIVVTLREFKTVDVTFTPNQKANRASAMSQAAVDKGKGGQVKLAPTALKSFLTGLRKAF